MSQESRLNQLADIIHKAIEVAPDTAARKEAIFKILVFEAENTIKRDTENLKKVSDIGAGMARTVSHLPPGLESHRFKQLTQDENCYTKARSRGLTTFSLTETDHSSPKTICFWIMENIETCPDDKLLDALMDALLMRRNPNRRHAD